MTELSYKDAGVNMKNGFTLVELSIVLVIIGLLIGGILVGQSLVSSAKINQAVRHLQQYDIAVGQFQERFKQLPGDSNLFTDAGNNNGSLEALAGGGTCGFGACSESHSFWKHLTDSRMLKGSYSNVFSSAANFQGEIDVNSPGFLEIPLEVTYSSSDNGAFAAKGWNYSSPFGIAPSDFFSIEAKIDDGNPVVGDVRGVSSPNPCDIAAEDSLCAPRITVMSSAGTPLN